MLRSLVLNVDYSFINITTSFKAFCLIYEKKAELLKAYENKFYHSQYLKIPVPAIIVMKEYKNLNKKKRLTAVSTRNVLLRDGFRCAYCLTPLSFKNGTRDHIVPLSKGGKNTLLNVISACKKCNSTKDNKTLEESGLKLHFQPRDITNSERLACLVKTCSSRERNTWLDWLKENNITIW